MHIINLSSVHDVSSRLPRGSKTKPLSVLRFRPNVVITGPPPFDEDDWRRARIGGNVYDVRYESLFRDKPFFALH